MKSVTAYAIVALSALSAHALPRSVKRDDAVLPTVDDTEFLNYALSLENLENAFYTQALAMFDEQAFNQSGFPPSTRARYVMISEHEQAHVALLNQTLGGNATQPCNYTFPFTDIPSFVNLSQLLEGVGTSAYIGAAQNITNSTYLSAAASILATEARHAAWIASAVNNGSAWDGPFDTPLTPRQVITLAAPYISSCPSTNNAVPPFTPFPSLSISPGLPGSVVTFTFNASTTPSSNNTNSTSSTGGSSTNGTSTGDPTSAGSSNNGTSTDPNAPPDGSASPTNATTSPDGSGSSSGGSSDPNASDGGSSTSDPSDPTASTNDGNDPSTSGTPDLSSRQDFNSTIPDTPPSNSTNGTSPTNSTSPGGNTPSNGTTPSANGTTLFAAFLSGLQTQFAPIGSDGNVTLPSNLTGQVYAVVTTNDSVVTDDNIVAGPTILSFNFDSQGNVTSGNQ